MITELISPHDYKMEAESTWNSRKQTDLDNVSVYTQASFKESISVSNTSNRQCVQTVCSPLGDPEYWAEDITMGLLLGSHAILSPWDTRSVAWDGKNCQRPAEPLMYALHFSRCVMTVWCCAVTLGQCMSAGGTRSSST